MDPRAALPSVTAMLKHPFVVTSLERHGREHVVAVLREVLTSARAEVRDGGIVPSEDEVAQRLDRRLAVTQSLRRVLNATGVVLHTNLGRAVLSEAAVAAMSRAAGTVDVEYDLGRGSRDHRGGHLTTLLSVHCHAEDALAVNNGAGALVLAMAAIAVNREVVVSRGELVEIGGSFRLPEILAVAGVRLREVGTTNRTRASDVAAAIGPETAVVLRVHTSNFRIEGFTEEPDPRALGRLAREAGVVYVHDIGSGLIRLPSHPVLRHEPDVLTALQDGADLVVFSGDKLLGGPQAGILAGRRDLVQACRRHPLARALRIDKLRIAALEATLESLMVGDDADVPTWAMLRATDDELRARAEAVAAAVGGRAVRTTAMVGAGSAPARGLDSWGVALDGQPHHLAEHLRECTPPVIGRILDDALVLDLRSILPEDDIQLVTALRDSGTAKPA